MIPRRVTQETDASGIVGRDRIEEIRWTKPGPVTVAESPAVVPSSNMVIDGFSVKLTSTGGAPTWVTVVLKKNGTVIATVTVGDTYPYASVTVPHVRLIGRKDSYTIAVTGFLPGTSPSDLSGVIEMGGGVDSPQNGTWTNH